jgi:acetyl-CoA carboxylase biotin carboxyl carrier protein
MNTEGLKKILEQFEKSSMAQFKYADGDVQLELRKATSAPLAEKGPAIQPVAQENTSINAAPVAATTITSPLAGIFYSSPAPGEAAFVKMGESFEVGRTIAVIEAMKLFNTIEAEFAGTILNVLVEDGAAVERGTPLFEIGS